MSNSIEEEDACFDVAKTECTETTDPVDIEVCTYVYDEMEVEQPAKTIQVDFEKKCQTQLVTFCEPGQSNSNNDAYNGSAYEYKSIMKGFY